MFCDPLDNCPLGRLEDAFHQLCAVDEQEKKVMRAVKEGTLRSLTLLEQINEAKELGILNAKETKQLKNAELARQEVIAVDDFAHDELARHDQAAKMAAKKERISSS